MKISKTFVVNLKNRTDRWKNITKNFSESNLILTKWDAVDGKLLSNTEIKKNTSTFCNMFCSYGMIGCALSHMNLWKYIVENNLDNVLVLEDDAKPIDNFNHEFDYLLNIIPDNYDLVYLGILNPEFDSINNNNNNIYVPYVAFGTHAYIISFNGANKLINHDKMNKVRYHIDASLSYYVYNNDENFNMYASKKQLVVQDMAIGSDIATDEHPFISYIFKYFKTQNVSLSFLLNLTVLHLRKYNISISILNIVLFLSSYFFGYFKMNCTILCFWMLYVIELFNKHNFNVKKIIFESIVYSLLMFLG